MMSHTNHIKNLGNTLGDLLQPIFSNPLTDVSKNFVAREPRRDSRFWLALSLKCQQFRHFENHKQLIYLKEHFLIYQFLNSLQIGICSFSREHVSGFLETIPLGHDYSSNISSEALKRGLISYLLYLTDKRCMQAQRKDCKYRYPWLCYCPTF